MTDKKTERSDKVNEFLKKKEVIERVGAPRTTVHDWMTDFSSFIPKVKNGSTVYYKPESVNVLLKVKEMREQGYDKTQIAIQLPQLGFAIEVDESVSKEVRTDMEPVNNRDALLAVIQTMGTAMERMTELEKAIQESQQKQLEQQRINEELKEQFEQQKRYITERLEERDRKLTEAMRHSQEQTRMEIAMAREEIENDKKSRGFWTRFLRR